MKIAGWVGSKGGGEERRGRVSLRERDRGKEGLTIAEWDRCGLYVSAVETGTLVIAKPSCSTSTYIHPVSPSLTQTNLI